jgi:hypothetical protein
MYRKITFSWLLCALTTPVFADASYPGDRDDYYSDDLEAAVTEAKQRTHHYDYSNTLRYNRTTSQSIEIPRLQNPDLAYTAIETPALAASAESLNIEQSVDPLLSNKEAHALSVIQEPKTGLLNIGINNAPTLAPSVTVTVR